MSSRSFQAITLHKHSVTDRRFYLIMALVCGVVIFAGFSCTYYLRFRFPMSPPLSLLVHIHAFVFTTWMLFFVSQTALIAVNRPGLHRRLGYTGALLGPAVIVLGLMVAFTAMRLHHGGPVLDAEVTFLVSLIDIGTFAIFFVAGYVFRRNREAHQRLMLLAVVAGLASAGIGRLGGLGLPLPALAVIGLGLLFAGPIYDLITRRRVHIVYVFGCVFALATFTPIRFVVGATPWWHPMAHLIAGM